MKDDRQRLARVRLTLQGAVVQTPIGKKRDRQRAAVVRHELRTLPASAQRELTTTIQSTRPWRVLRGADTSTHCVNERYLIADTIEIAITKTTKARRITDTHCPLMWPPRAVRFAERRNFAR